MRVSRQQAEQNVRRWIETKYPEPKEDVCFRLEHTHSCLRLLWQNLEHKRPREEENQEQRETRRAVKKLVFFLDGDLDEMSEKSASSSEEEEEKEK